VSKEGELFENESAHFALFCCGFFHFSNTPISLQLISKWLFAG